MPLVPLEGTGDLATAEDVAAPHLPAPTWPVSKPPLGSWEAVKGHGAHTLFVAPLRCPEQPPSTAVWLQRAGHKKGAKGELSPAVPVLRRTRTSSSEPFPSRERRCFDLRLDCFGVGWNLLSKQHCSQNGWVGLTPQLGV